VDRVLARLEREAEGRQIAWVVPSLQSVTRDPGLVEQVFLNLLGNSIK
jgi:signal transduction histidine kinase